MAAQPDPLRDQIIGKREEIADDLIRLEDRLRSTYRETTDWRRYVKSRPLTIAGAGMALGLFLGLTVGGMFD